MERLLFALLVTLCGSQDYRTRDAATRRLIHLADIAIIQLVAGEHSSAPEIRARCRPIVDAWHRRHAGELLDEMLERKPAPWLDMLPEDYPGREFIVWPLVSEVHQHGGYGTGAPAWPDYSEASRRWLLGLVAARIDVGPILDRMRANQQEYCRTHGLKIPD
jgi:hypothetical protein